MGIFLVKYNGLRYVLKETKSANLKHADSLTIITIQPFCEFNSKMYIL